MPESRDRIARPVDIAAVYAQRIAGTVHVLSDEEANLLGSPLSTIPTPTSQYRARRGGAVRRGRLGNRIVTRRCRDLVGENSPSGSVVRGRSRITNSVLPSWYPRTPLRDVSTIVRAIERRRRLGDIGGQQTPISVNQTRHNTSISLSGGQLKHNLIECTPVSVFKTKSVSPAIDKVSSILLELANDTDMDLLTPQKKLLSCIDTVEKVVKEELQKLEKTPSAKRADRKKRVRVLMSMR